MFKYFKCNLVKITFYCSEKSTVQKLVDIMFVDILVKNKYTKMYLQYIYFVLSKLQIHLPVAAADLLKRGSSFSA